MNTVFPQELQLWLDKCCNDDSMSKMRGLAIEASNLIRKSADLCYPLVRILRELLEHLGTDLSETDRFWPLACKLSEMALYLFHISTAGAVRCSHSLGIKLRNAPGVFSQDVDALRNVYIMRNRLAVIHFFDKAGSARGVDFDPEKPVILIPHIKVGSRLLIYFAFVLPIAISIRTKYMFEKARLLQANDARLENEKLVLSMKSQYPFLYLGWEVDEPSQKLTMNDVFKRAQAAYYRCFRRSMIRCKTD